MSLYTFKRYELKYLLTPQQYEAILKEISQYTTADAHGQSMIQSLYYDTDNFRLIRRSMERPEYKEKLRLRSYGPAHADDNVFLELKKKSEGIVFKRRIELKLKDVAPFLNGERGFPSQIAKEIGYFLNFYGSLRPKLLLLYDRTAYFGSGDLRITFDTNIRYRRERLSLNGGTDGIRIRSDDKILMEIKTSTAFPLWLARLLSREQIRKTTFSKYGEAYRLECRCKEERKVG